MDEDKYIRLNTEGELITNTPVIENTSTYVPRTESDFMDGKKVHKGKSGVLYKYTNKLDGKEYAIMKVDETMTDPVLAILKQYAKISHPNIIRYYQGWREYPEIKNSPSPRTPINTGGIGYIQMEYSGTETLSYYLSPRSQRLNSVNKWRITHQCLEALSHLHEIWGISHNQLSPNYIFIDKSNNIKLLLPLIPYHKFRDGNIPESNTPGEDYFYNNKYLYTPPEGLGENEDKFKGDAYSMGLILYILWNIEKFKELKVLEAEIIMMREQKEFPSNLELNTEYNVDKIIYKLLSRDPNIRPYPHELVRKELAHTFTDEKLNKFLMSICNPQSSESIKLMKDLFKWRNEEYKEVMYNHKLYKHLSGEKNNLLMSPTNTPTPYSQTPLRAFITKKLSKIFKIHGAMQWEGSGLLPFRNSASIFVTSPGEPKIVVDLGRDILQNTNTGETGIPSPMGKFVGYGGNNRRRVVYKNIRVIPRNHTYLDKNRVYLKLPYELITGWARYMSRNPAGTARSYEIGRIYDPTMTSLLSPIFEITFNIVQDLPQAIPRDFETSLECELLSVCYDALSNINLVEGLEIIINSTIFLDAIFQYMNIMERLREKIYEIFAKSIKDKSSTQNIQNELIRMEIEENIIYEIMELWERTKDGIKGSNVQAWKEFIEYFLNMNIISISNMKREIKKEIVHIERIWEFMKCTKALPYIYINIFQPPENMFIYHSGIFFQITYTPPVSGIPIKGEENQPERRLIGYGGRYDNLLRHYSYANECRPMFGCGLQFNMGILEELVRVGGKGERVGVADFMILSTGWADNAKFNITKDNEDNVQKVQKVQKVTTSGRTKDSQSHSKKQITVFTDQTNTNTPTQSIGDSTTGIFHSKKYEKYIWEHKRMLAKAHTLLGLKIYIQQIIWDAGLRTIIDWKSNYADHDRLGVKYLVILKAKYTINRDGVDLCDNPQLLIRDLRAKGNKTLVGFDEFFNYLMLLKISKFKLNS